MIPIALQNHFKQSGLGKSVKWTLMLLKNLNWLNLAVLQEEILNRYDVFVGSQVRLTLQTYITIYDQHTLTSV